MSAGTPSRDPETSPEPLDLGFDDDHRGADPAGGATGKVGLARQLLERLEARGRFLGRYRVGEEIGRGGMGAVFEVWDEDLRRHLAMKVLREPLQPSSALDRERFLARFVEEAQVSGQLQHPGIVPVHELGVDEEGRVFFTMKLVQGRTLKELLECNREGDEAWSDVRVLGVLLRVCEALAYAHDKGVVHRDLKPSNVMVGDFGEVYVLDWGLARLLGESSRDSDIPGAQSEVVRSDRSDHRDQTPGSPLMTQAGAALGTAMYCAPEQARGEEAAAGPAADVYSLGAMLYELLAGRPPYVGRDESPSPSEVFARVCAGPPKELAELAPLAPPELRAICARAMARDASDRYDSMTGLGDQLREFHEGKLVAAEVLAERDRLARVVEAQTGLFERLAPSAFGARIRTGAREELRGKLLQVERPEDEVEAALAAFDEALAQVNFTNAGVDALRAEVLQPARDVYDREFAADPVSHATLLDSLADAHERCGQIEPALELRRTSIELRRERLGWDAPETLDGRVALASLLKTNGELTEARSILEEAVDQLRRTRGEEDTSTLDALGSLAGVLWNQGELEASLEIDRGVFEAHMRVNGPEHHSTIVARSNFANALRGLGRFTESLPVAREALEASRRVLGLEHRNTLDMTSNVGYDLSQLSRWEEALPFYEEALATRRRVLGDDHPETLISVNNLGHLLSSLQRHDEGRSLLEEAVRGYSDAFGRGHPGTLVARNNLGLQLHRQESFEEALPHLEEVVDRGGATFAAGDARFVNMRGNLAITLEALGRPEEARAHLEEALGDAEEALGRTHLSTIIAQWKLAKLLVSSGLEPQADALLQRALPASVEGLGAEHHVTLKLRELQAELDSRRG